MNNVHKRRMMFGISRQVTFILVAPLLTHIVNLSALRDRTALASRLVHALVELFPVQHVLFHRRLFTPSHDWIYPCAGFIESRHFSHDIYLPEPRLFKATTSDPLIVEAIASTHPVKQHTPHQLPRLVFPVVYHEDTHYLIDISFAEHPAATTVDNLQSFCRFIANHLALIDYSETDTLTSLPNRKTFDEHLFRVLGDAQHDETFDAEHRRSKQDADTHHWLAVLDIDRFKSINDTYGHLIGDEVLMLVARLLRQASRLEDPLFRMGGEEFVILLQPTTQKNAVHTLNRLRETISAYPFPKVGKVTISGGFSQVLGFDAPADILDRADEALYYAKAHGRNQIHCYENLVDLKLIERKSVNTSEIELF